MTSSAPIPTVSFPEPQSPPLLATMSEYQNYQWACVTRRLTPAQRSEVATLSSHIRVGSHDAEASYHWGDFKHDPRKVLRDYFDVYTYIANWGYQEVVFRFPPSPELADALKPFATDEFLAIQASPSDLFLGAYFDENWSDYDNSDEFEGSVISSAICSVYQEILSHDLRGPFLLWLKACEFESADADAPTEAPVPPGLNQLQAHHKTVIDFVGIDSQLVEEAAKLSPALREREPEIALASDESLARLTPAQKDTILRQLISDDPYHARENLTELMTEKDPITVANGPLTDFPSLAARAQAADEEEQRQKAAEAEKKRIQHLDELACREGGIWTQVDEQIALKNTNAYDQAIFLLGDLHDLYTAREDLDSFLERIVFISQAHPRLSGLRRRLETAGWIA